MYQQELEQKLGFEKQLNLTLKRVLFGYSTKRDIIIQCHGPNLSLQQNSKTVSYI